MQIFLAFITIYFFSGVRCLIFLFSLVSGVDIKEVQEMVETHLKDMILKHFDPKKADSIFTDEGEVGDAP